MRRRGSLSGMVSSVARVAGGASATAGVIGLGAMAGMFGPDIASASSAKLSTSRTFAGYEVAEAKTHIRTASVTFVVPTITCKKSYSGVGPSVVIASTVHNNRYSDSGGGIAVVCQNKQPDYVALPIVDGTNYNDSNVPIAAGDKVTVAVHYGRKTTVTLTDETSHEVDKHSGKGSLGEDAYFGDSGLEINHRGVGLDPFTTTSFSAATVNGRRIGKESPLRFEWVDRHNVPLVRPSSLSHEDAFTTTFKHST